jgi:DNA transposase THAP9
VKGGWKPWQRGILVATTAYMQLAERLLKNSDYEFVLGGRFSTNCVENLFSVLRLKNKVPTVMQWKNCLKAIILSQYARSVPSSSYEQELSENFNDCLTMKALDFLGKSIDEILS